MARGDPTTAAPRHRRGVHDERDLERRLLDADPRQRRRTFEVGERVSDLDLVDPGDAADVSRARSVDLHARERLEPVDLDHFCAHVLLFTHAHHVLARGDPAGHDAPDREPPDIVVVLDVVDDHLQRRRAVPDRLRDVGD